MNFRSITLGDHTRFYSTWALYEAALQQVRSDQALGLISHRAPAEVIAMEGQACSLLAKEIKGHS